MIADASVLITFARAQRLPLFFATLGTVRAPRAVVEESVEAAPHRPDAQAVAKAMEDGRLTTVTVRSAGVVKIMRRYRSLGPGEAAVIAAALQQREGTVLMDELAARRAARLEGLTPVGSLGILARGRRQRKLRSNEELGAAVRDLVAAGLWVSPEVVEALWVDVGERP